MEGRGRKGRDIQNKWREAEERGEVLRINGGKGKEGEGYSESMEGRGRKGRSIKNKWREGEGRGGVLRVN